MFIRTSEAFESSTTWSRTGSMPSLIHQAVASVSAESAECWIPNCRYSFEYILQSGEIAIIGLIKSNLVLHTYYHCHRMAETNHEYLNREPIKFHQVFCNQQPYVLDIRLWILFWYCRGCRSSGTQPRHWPQNPGIYNKMSQHVTDAEFKFCSACFWCICCLRGN